MINLIFKIFRTLGIVGMISFLIGATVLGAINRPYVSYDSANTLYFCNQTCFNMMFISPIVMWILFGAVIIAIFVLLLAGHVKTRNYIKETTTQNESSINTNTMNAKL